MRVLLTLLLTFIPLLPLYPYELTKIILKGHLKKTKESTVLSILKVREGDQIAEPDLKDLEERLIKSGIFVEDRIRLELIPAGSSAADLELYLDEKISFLPLPVLTVREGEIEGGLFLIDSNFLGRGDQLYAGGLFSSKSQFALGQYTKRYIRGSAFDAGVNGAFYNGNNRINDTRGNRVVSYDALECSAGLYVQWSSDIWTLKSAINGRYLNYTDNSEKRALAMEPGVTVSYNGRRFTEFFWDGPLVTGQLSGNKYNDNSLDSFETSLSAFWGISILPRLQINLRTGGTHYTGESIFSPSVRSIVLPSDIHGNDFITGSLQLLPVLLDFSWGFLALPVSMNAGYFDGISGEDEFFWGPSVSLTLYLKEVALPALAIAYGWNAETETGQFQFSLGFQ